MLKKLSLIALMCVLAGCSSTGQKQAADTAEASAKEMVKDAADAHSKHWLTDMEKAQAKAKAENKDILMFFTGSDWCGWCIQLVEEVFSKQEFLDYAEKHFVLVDLDFPEDDSHMSKEQIAHNDAWKEKFPDLSGFPTVYLTDHNAKAYAETGYEEGGPEAYNSMLAKLKQGKNKITSLTEQLQKASGIERAKLLDELVSLGSMGLYVDGTEGKADEIMALTKGKDSELYTKYLNIAAENRLMDAMDNMMSSGQPPSSADMVKVFKENNTIKSGSMLYNLVGGIGDAFIGESKAKEGVAFMDTITSDTSYAADIRQASQLFKGIITMYGSKDKNKEALAIDFFKETIKMDPKTGEAERAKEMIKEASKGAGGI